MIFDTENPGTIYHSISNIKLNLKEAFIDKEDLKSEAMLLEDYIQEEAKGVFQLIVASLNATSNSEQILRLFGSLTPIFNVSKTCSEASWTMLYSFNIEPEVPWPLSCIY